MKTKSDYARDDVCYVLLKLHDLEIEEMDWEQYDAKVDEILRQADDLLEDYGKRRFEDGWKAAMCKIEQLCIANKNI